MKIKIFNNKKIKRIGKEFSLLIIGQILILIGGVVGTRVLTEYISPDIFGEVAIGMTVLYLSQQIIFGPIGNSVSRFLPPSIEKDEYNVFIISVVRLYSRGMFFLLGIGLIAITSLMVFGKSHWILKTILIIIFVFLTSLNNGFNIIQNTARNRGVVVLHQIINQWGRYLITFFMVALFIASTDIVFFAYNLTLAIALISQILFYKWKIHDKFYNNNKKRNDNYLVQMQEYLKPFQKWGIFTWLQLSADRWALQFFTNSYTLGLYSVLYSQGYNMIVMLTNNLTQLLTPIYFSIAGDGTDKQRVENSMRKNFFLVIISIFITILSVIGMIFLHKFIFRIIVAEEYRSVSYLLPLMVYAGGIFASGQFLSINFLTAMNTKAILMPKIITSIIGLLLSFLGASYYGLDGVVWGVAIYSTLYFLTLVPLSVKEYRKIKKQISYLNK